MGGRRWLSIGGAAALAAAAMAWGLAQDEPRSAETPTGTVVGDTTLEQQPNDERPAPGNDAGEPGPSTTTAEFDTWEDCFYDPDTVADQCEGLPGDPD